MTNKELAKEIFKIVGSKSNVLKAENCMTRLRLQLKDKAIDVKAIKELNGVLGVNSNELGIQVIVGPGKAGALATEFNNLLKDSSAISLSPKAQIGQGDKLHAQIKEKNATPFKLLLQKIAHIFVPLVPGFIACGLIIGILNILLKFDPLLETNPNIQMLAIAGNSVFWGLNLFVGFNAAKEFGGSPILGGILAAILTHPNLSNITLFQETLVPGRGGIIAVLLVVACSSFLEKKLHKIIPEILDLFVTPLLVVVISTFIALYVLQPLGGILSENIGYAATTAINGGGAITGFILGGIFLPLVMTGLHQGLVPIHAELLNQYGVTILLPIIAMAGAGQVGAAIAVYFKSKNKRIKKTILSALPVGIMGVGEPLIYGITLPLGKPFIGACIGGAFGGAMQAFYVVGATSIGLSGLPLAVSTDNISCYLIGLITAYIFGFIATWFIGFEDPIEE